MQEHSATRWYAIQVRPKHEAVVASRLQRWGFEVFLPKYRMLKEDNSVLSLSQVLFPGYVFCSLALPTIPKLYHMPGVIRILGPPRHPTPIEDDEIRQLKTLVHSVLPLEVHPFEESRAHTSVPIVRGPLAGMMGSVLQFGDQCKIVISFPGIQCSVSVSVPAEWVNPGDIKKNAMSADGS